MYFDGALNSKGNGIGIVLMSPEGEVVGGRDLIREIHGVFYMVLTLILWVCVGLRCEWRV